MEELIKVTQNSSGQLIASARDLHSFLSSSPQHVNEWMTENIKNNEYCEEGIDYQRITFKGENGRYLMDYALSIDFAKELCMMSKCEKGKEARKYFISCEKALLSKYKVIPDFSNPVEAARAWADEYEAKLIAETKVKELEPKADYYDAVMKSETAISVEDMAKIFDIKGMGRNNLFKFLKEKKVLMKNKNPYQNYIEEGLCRVIETTKNGMVFTQTLFHQKGVERVFKLLKDNGYDAKAS